MSIAACGVRQILDIEINELGVLCKGYGRDADIAVRYLVNVFYMDQCGHRKQTCERGKVHFRNLGWGCEGRKPDTFFSCENAMCYCNQVDVKLAVTIWK